LFVIILFLSYLDEDVNHYFIKILIFERNLVHLNGLWNQLFTLLLDVLNNYYLEETEG